MAERSTPRNGISHTSDWALFRRFWGFLSPYRRWAFTGLALVPLMTLASLAQPYVLKVGIDEYILNGDAEGLLGISLILLALVGTAYIVGAVQGYCLQIAAIYGIGDLRRHIYRHVMDQGARFFDRHPTGSLLTRTTTDVEGLGEMVAMGMVGIFGDVLTIVGIVVAMFLLDVQLTLLTFSVSPLLVVLVNFFRKRLREYGMQIRKTLARLNGLLAEHIVGIEVVQLFGREEKSAREFKALNYSYLRAYKRSNWYDASLYAIMDGISSVCVAVMLWVGGGYYLEERAGLTLGLLVAFIEYISRVFVPIREFSGKVATLQRAIAALERIFKLLDTRDAISPGDPAHSNASIVGHLRFQGVSFRYREDSESVLHDIDLALEPRKVVALVGRTGSGKTTIGKLITRMYDGYQGSITLDGVELSDIPPHRVHELIGVVQQDVHLFAGSVLDNITLANPAISRDRAIEAAELVHADRFIRNMPGGFDAPVAERGANLSSGQAQLIAFARSMAHDPPVIVLDEATSSIDSLLEADIQQAIERILTLKTVLVVAHRLSTIQKADEILVLRRGRVAERGRHDDLLAANGAYARLCRSRIIPPQ